MMRRTLAKPALADDKSFNLSSRIPALKKFVMRVITVLPGRRVNDLPSGYHGISSIEL
jgi:hypothetical protein